MRYNLENIQGRTHTGYKRQRNEDRYLIQPLENEAGILLAVADGMGGVAGGDIAAQIVVDTLKEYRKPGRDIEHDLARILDRAGRTILKRTDEQPGLKDMGTTATVVLLTKQQAYWVHSGDSRLYVKQKGKIRQITTDHTFVQDLIQDGTLTQKEAERHPLKNVLDQCVGCAELKPDSGRLPFGPGEKLLLCSDGLSRYVSEEAISKALDGKEAGEIADRLVQSALEAGGRDNVTVVVLI